MNIYIIYEKLIKEEDPNILKLFCGIGATDLYLKRSLKYTHYRVKNNTNSSSLAEKVLNPLIIMKLKSNNIIFNYLIINI